MQVLQLEKTGILLVVVIIKLVCSTDVACIFPSPEILCFALLEEKLFYLHLRFSIRHKLPYLAHGSDILYQSGILGKN